MTRRIVFALAIAALLQWNCASKKQVRTEVDRIDKEMTSIESSIEQSEVRIKEHDSRIAEHDQKLTQLSTETQEAITRAQKAEKLAMGKLLYEVTLTDDRVKFKSSKSELPDTAKDILNNLVEQLKADNKSVFLEIQGYTDSNGSEEYNIKLGQDRADSVRRYLAENGIPLHRMSTISYGEGRPIAPNTSSEGRSKNRRVVVLVLE